MRKGLSVILAAALILGSFTMAFGAVPPDVAGTDYEDSVSVLMDLGVINGYEDGTYKPERVVTRAEMAKLIIVALGLESSAGATTSKFPDMAGAAWAQGFVAMASDLGIVIGYPDGTFQPANTVTYNEAITMILRALGYSDRSLPGTWPSSYIVKAKLLGILDDLEGKIGGANRGDIAMMLFRSLALDIGTTGADGVWTANEGDNFLTRLDAEAAAAAVITGEEDTNINLRPFVGAYAATYLNEDGNIIAVAPETEFLTGTYDGTVFTSDDEDYSVAASVASTVRPYFENGLKGSVKGLDDFTDEEVTIAATLSGKTIKMIYSISTWAATAGDLYSSADDSDVEKDSMLFGYEFMLDDEDNIDPFSFEIIGASSLSKISTNDVVYVYADNLDNIRRVAVGTEVVTGKVTKISTGDKYTIGGKIYAVTEEDVSPDITGAVGDEVKAYLDAYGDIFMMEVTSGLADNYGIVLEVADGMGSSLTGYEPAISIFTNDGEAEDFIVDEGDADMKASYFTNSGTPKVWVDEPAAGTIVKYGLDDEDAVDAISEAYESATDDITGKGYFDGRIIASNAMIFTYSGDDLSDGDNYSVKELSEILNMDNVTADYFLDEDTGKIAAILIKSGLTEVENYGVVIDLAENNSSVGYEITFLLNGIEMTYNAKEAAYASAVDKEKLFKVNFDLTGNVAALTEPASYITVTDADIEDFVLTSGGNHYTLDQDVIVYKWNQQDGVYDVGDLSDVTGALLYDVHDDDGVYDIILIPPAI